MNRFIAIKSKMTILNFAIASFMMAFAFFAPSNFFAENSIIEWLEVVTLLLGATFCFVEYRKNRTFKHFFLTIGFLLLIFIGRELSWGRVFAMDDLGNIPKRKDWIFGPYIYYILYPTLLAIIIHAYKTKFIQNAILLLRKAPIMIFDFALAATMVAISIIAEKHLIPESMHHLSYAIEESAEVALYFIIAIIISSYSRKNLLENIKK